MAARKMSIAASSPTPAPSQRSPCPVPLPSDLTASLEADDFLLEMKDELEQRIAARKNPIVVEDSSDDLEQPEDDLGSLLEPNRNETSVEANAAQFGFEAMANGYSNLKSNNDNSIPT